LGLGDMLADLFLIDHPKGLQKADWAKRPLTPEMCSYAQMDTHYLMRLRDTLNEQLVEKNLLDLAHEDFKRICQVESHPIKRRMLYSQVSGFNKLNPQELSVLNELSRYRDDLARKMDRPHFKVMENSLLLAVAQSQPVTSDALKKVDGVTPRVFERYGEGLIASVKRGLTLKPLELEKHTRPAQTYLKRLQDLQDWRKEEGKKMKVPSDVILPRDVMEQIAASRPENLSEMKTLMISIPWRYKQFGREILKVISKGKSS
jgi:ribonuclease D